MTKKLKLPIGILTVLAVFLAALLFLPLGATDGFAITASAEGEEFEGSFCPCDTKEYISNGNGTHNEVCSICYSVSDGDIPCKFENNNGFCSECGGYQPATDSNSDGVYEIGNAGQLYWFADKVNNDNANFGSANAKLTANITVNTGDVAGCDGEWQTGWRYWESIGKTDTNPYKGTFDGNGFYVSGLYFYDSATDYVGLFGYNKGTIKNVGVVNSYFKGRDNIGGVCGYNNYGTITNCYNTGTVDAGSIIGGVCGYNNYGTITNCYNTGEVSGTSSNKGGVCGFNFGTIKNCYYLDTTASDSRATSKIAEQFASGEVAYLLGQGCTIDDTFYSGNVWGQNIGNTEPIQAYPVLSGKTVYQCTPCTGKYSNNNSAVGEHTATYINGFGTCTDCGKEAYQPATLNNGVYEIGNAGQLYWFAQQVNGGNTGISAILNNNITVNSGDVANCNGTKAEGWRDWTPIGNSESNAYTGTFDGNGKTISGLYYKNTGANNIGLFGYNKGTIKNVGVVNSYFKGNQHVGGVCGRNGENHYIQNCYNTGTISGRGYFVGGVCGQNYGTITNCNNTGTVSGTYSSSSFTGGVCGSNANTGKINNCYNTGTVSGTNLYVGGVNGCNYGSITNCYNTGAVSGIDCSAVGGVCGENDKSITNCYNTGTVSGPSKTSGGVCGYNNKGTITNCYNTGTVSGSSNVCGYNNSAIENCYYLEESETDSIDGTTFKIAAQFASGEVAYLLQGTQTTDVWGQTLTVENKQAYPVLGGTKVYPCTKGCTAKYANTEGATGEHTAPDTYDKDGFGNCKDCDADVYQPATLNNGVYQIGNAGQLYWFAEQVNGENNGINAVLTADITLPPAEGESNWTPIYNYTGTFDGNNKTISGLYFSETGACAVGLFGSISIGGTVKNVGVVDSYISGCENVGGVCGVNDGGTIKDCYNEGSVSGFSRVGGVCGENSGTIANCHNTEEVSGNDYRVGGVCGMNNNDGTIKNSYNTGSVSNANGVVGGVCGENIGTIKNSYNTGSLSKNGDVGGVCGQNNTNGTISNCYCLVGTATNAIGYNAGTSTSDKVESKTLTQFNSGEVAYLLQSGQTEDENGIIPEVWGQDLSTTTNYPVLGGAKVYQTLGCVGYSNDPTKKHKDENGDEICDVCKEYVDGIGAKLIGYTLSLNGNIGVNFYMELSEDIASSETAYMKFTLPNGDVTTVKVADVKGSPATVGGKTYYVFPCEVAAKEMTDTIKAQMIYGEQKGTIYTYTVKDYADYILANPTAFANSEKTVALVKAMLNYGAYSQLYFSYNPDNLANAGLAEADKALPEITAETLNEYAASFENDSNYEGNTAYYGSSLVLKSGTDIKHYFTPDPSVSVGNYTCSDGTNSYDVAASGSYIYVRVPNILAHNLGNNVSLTLYENEIAVGTISYSPMSYAYAVLNKYPEEGENDTLRNVVIALYDYYTKAKAYRAA